MRELYAEFCGPNTLAMRDHMRERRLIRVGIEPKAAMRDAADALDMRRFNDEEPGAGIRQHAKMREMPVIGTAIVGAVLAHRRDDDAVSQGEGAQLQRGEEQG